MSQKPGTPAPQSGIYWCSVCKTPVQFKQGEDSADVQEPLWAWELGVCEGARSSEVVAGKN